MERFTCPHCDCSIKAERKLDDRKVLCPFCKSPIKIPGIEVVIPPKTELVLYEPIPIPPAPPPPDYEFQLNADLTVTARWKTVDQALTIANDLDDAWQEINLMIRATKEQLRQANSAHTRNNRATGPSMYGLGFGKAAHFVKFAQFMAKTAAGVGYAAPSQGLEQQMQRLVTLLLNIEHTEIHVRRWLRDSGAKSPQRAPRTRRRS